MAIAVLGLAVCCLTAPALAAVMAAGGDHNLFVNDQGTVWGQGDDGFGQINVPAGLVGTGSAVAAGQDHSLALKADGTVVAWGDNDYGQCNVPPYLSGVVAVAAGRYHSLALKADGTVVAWGLTIRPMHVPAAQSGVVAVAGGEIPQPGPEGRRLRGGLGR